MSELILILLIVVGIPILSITFIIIKAMENKNKRKMHSGQFDETELREIYYGLQDLNKRIDNLETIMYQRNPKDGGSSRSDQ